MKQLQCTSCWRLCLPRCQALTPALPSPPPPTSLPCSDVASDGGTFGFSEFVFTADDAFEVNIWSAVNRSVLFNTKVTLA